MTSCPPELTAASRTFVKLLDATESWSRRRAWVTCIATCIGVLTLELLTPVTVSTAIAYMLATAFLVWALGEGGALLLCLLTVVGGAVIKHIEMQEAGLPPLGLASEVWNSSARFLSAAVLGVLVNGLRSALLLERWRASCDGLTGALNKMAFTQRMDEVIAGARATGRTLVLAYMDLDGFKAVNDRHGHASGDQVLRAFAGAATQAIRASDLFARIGGDEFVALLSVRSCDEGDMVAAMLHERLTAILKGTGFDVTCSMGALVADAATLVGGGNMLELADMLMYEVKRSGKNALRVARGGPLGTALRAAYPPPEEPAHVELLRRIDRADRARPSLVERRTAA